MVKRAGLSLTELGAQQRPQTFRGDWSANSTNERADNRDMRSSQGEHSHHPNQPGASTIRDSALGDTAERLTEQFDLLPDSWLQDMFDQRVLDGDDQAVFDALTSLF